MSSMFCTKIYRCKNANWCARDFNPKSDEPECFELLTNYDRLISKTPEELAEMLSRSGKYFCCDTTKCDPHSERCDYGDECYDCWLDWLKQEAET